MQEYDKARDRQQVLTLHHTNVKLTDDSKVGILGIKGSPSNARERDISVVHLPWRLVEDLANDQSKEQRHDLEQLHGCSHQTKQYEVRDIEVARFWKVLSK